jgi:hypothetical protein
VSACGKVCPSGQICSNGTCILVCSPGWTNCSGVCVNLATDPQNCGACGKTCPSNSSCVSGTCTGSFVTCGGYNYPTTTIVNTTCSGWFSSCTGSREFRVVGCYTSNPSASDCPSGFSVATLMLIGQWAQAANITRYVSGTSVCMYTGGSSATTSCGGTHTSSYCWPRGEPCLASCPSNCCPSSGPCGSTPYQAPLLCVK